MHGILGRLLVLIALSAASFGAIAGLTAGYRQSIRGIRWTRWSVYVFAAAMIAANVVMVRALLVHDFSVSYVAHVGSRATPTWVTIVSLWSSLEGSILFWGLILGGYLASFALIMADRYREYMGYALGVMMLVATFFAFMIAGPANPFGAVDPVPPDGPGPNPLLQNHILMVVHPPMLYLGYVGMTVPFGIAVAGLLRGQMSPGWLKPLRRWTLVPWTCLGIGIALGGWWAYEVLGWGGYWAWDPVENASFHPWLVATAYLHSSVLSERKRIMKPWTIGLVLVAFLLTILGTFMTRSGVFNSVHSFTQSSIGPAFLAFFFVASLASLILLAGRAHVLEGEGSIESPLSREFAFLINNLVFAIFTFTVLLGTTFPLVVEAFKGTKMSVGEPYFNTMAVPACLTIVFLMGVGPSLPWGKPKGDVLVRSFVPPLLFGGGVSGLCALLGVSDGLLLLTFGVCGFAILVTLREMFGPGVSRARSRDESLAHALGRSISGGRRRFGGYIVHLAIIGITVGVGLSATYKVSKEVSLTPGESFTLGEYLVQYRETKVVDEPHRFRVESHLEVSRGGRVAGVGTPALNYYRSQREPIGTPHVMTFGATDLYLSLLSTERDGSRVGIKAYTIPGVPLIWWSLPFIALGALIALWPRRRSRTTVPGGATAPS